MPVVVNRQKSGTVRLIWQGVGKRTSRSVSRRAYPVLFWWLCSHQSNLLIQLSYPESPDLLLAAGLCPDTPKAFASTKLWYTLLDLLSYLLQLWEWELEAMKTISLEHNEGKRDTMGRCPSDPTSPFNLQWGKKSHNGALQAGRWGRSYVLWGILSRQVWSPTIGTMGGE